QLLTFTLFSFARGNIWPNQEREYVTENPHNILSDYNVQDSSVRSSNIPILSTSILPPLRKDSISWAGFSRNNEGSTKKSSLIVVSPTEATFSNENEMMIEPIAVNTIQRYSTSFTTPTEIISPETRTPVFESLINPRTITVAPDGNANIIGIERNDEIASDDRSKKLFLCGSLRNELIVSRPGSGSVFIKGASRVAIIDDDAQNSVIVCPPSTSLIPPSSFTDERLPMDLERKPLTLRPSVILSEIPKTRGSNERPSTIVLKDYLLPPYTN
ncbi:hypothetical protein M0804_010576, partial [Polistes exclamans]